MIVVSQGARCCESGRLDTGCEFNASMEGRCTVNQYIGCWRQRKGERTEI
jgi:hypothetical protein